MKYGQRNPYLDLDVAERYISRCGAYTAASNSLTGISYMLLLEVKRLEGILTKERKRTVRQRASRTKRDNECVAYWLRRVHSAVRVAERRTWERAIGVLVQHGRQDAAVILAQQGWAGAVPNPTLEWFDQQIRDAEANSETSTFIAWLKQGRATITKETTQ